MSKQTSPIASFTFTPLTGVAPLAVTFDASSSSDPGGTITSYAWDFADGQTGTGVKVTHTFLTARTYPVKLTVTDSSGATGSTSVNVQVEKPHKAPIASFTFTPATGVVPLHVAFDGSASSDPDGTIVGYSWDFGDGQQGSGAKVSHTYSTPGTYTVTLNVTDNDGDMNSTTQTLTAKVNQPPTAVFTLTPTTGIVPLHVTCDASASSDPDDSIVGYAWDFGDGQHGSGVNVTHTYSTAGSYTLTLTVTDSGGLTGSISHTLSVSSGGPPPDPSKVAPPVDPTVATRLLDATAFLYTGPNPIQTGVAAGKIDLKRVAVLRGKVTDRSGAPLAGVTISILTHSEFGSTLTRSDGMFDLAVNGGGLLTVSYTKDGSLPAQRHIQVPWQDYAWLPDVVLIPLDSAVTPLDLTASVPIQVARGSAVSDSDGSRQATLLVPQGTQATLVLPNSSTQAIQKLSMRATEYTVGASGPATMPAELPPTSGYTYAVEYSADEALAAGATSVTFSQPLIHYSENFLNFSVGMAVPVGSYDKGKAAWIPSDNGQVLKILSITNGLADLDTTGNGTADNGTALGITTAERQSLAVLYSANQVLWRVPLTHFSAWDFNWAYSPPPDAVPPNQPDPTPDDPPDDQCTTPGSLIETQSQVLGETAIITGTPFRLHYRSYRVPDRKAAFSLKIPLSGASIPHNLKRIDLEVYVAGQRFTQSFPAAPNQSTAFVWDGNDAYGRRLQGAQPITVRIGYAYANVAYQSPAQRLRAFAVCLGIPLSGSVARAETILWKEWQSGIGAWDARAAGMGSWTLDVHHAYDPLSQVLYLGTGERRHAQKLRPIITTIAGNGVLPPGASGDGGPAAAAQIWDAQGLALGPDGSFYIADDANHRIRRVGSDGIISTVVSGLAYPHGLALGPDGSLYIAETGGHRIRRLGSDGSLTTVAGTGTWGYSGDGGPASTAQLNSPQGVALGPDGSLYIADMGNFRVRRVGPDGIITTVAGQGDQAYSGEGGPATAARLYEPLSVAVATDGSLYIGELYRVRRVAPAFPGMSLVDFLIPSEDGSEVYFFNGAGRHLRTLDALTGAVRYQFTYDSAGHLASVTDGDGKVTTIEHDGSGNPTAIVGPYGQRTALALDANGYLASITDPAGESMQLTSTTDGLLTSLTDPRGNVYTFSYDAQGRLVKDADPAGGAKDLVRSDQSNGYTVSVVTALLQQSSYQVQQLSTGDERRVNACCGGLQTQVLQQTNGTTTVTAADGTVTTQVLGPDPRWGMLAPPRRE